MPKTSIQLLSLATSAVTGQWLHQDAAAAFGWLASLQDLEVRQKAALAMEELLLQQPAGVRDSWRR